MLFVHVCIACVLYSCRYISGLLLCMPPLLFPHCCQQHPPPNILLCSQITTMSTASSSKSFKCALCNEAFGTRGQRDYHRHKQCVLRNKEKVCCVCGCSVTWCKHIQTIWLARRILAWLSHSLGPALPWSWMVTGWRSLRVRTE